VACRVICISPTEGGAGHEVAALVGERLGFRLVDEAIVARAAQQAGVEADLVADVEARKSLLHRLLEDLGSSSGVSTLAVGGGFVPPVDDKPTSDELRALIREAIDETASQGDAVIVAHAASFALGERPDVLRVLVTASPQTCSRRVAAIRGCSQEEAAAAVRSSDAARASYLQRFYGVSAERPSHYDLVVNTDRLTPEQAAALVVAAAGAGT
jgi:chloramphenicol 3-O-phosphotransferase